MSYSNSEFRQRAWKALKNVFPIALVVSLIATLPTLLGQVAVTRTGVPMVEAMRYITLNQDLTATQMMTVLEKAFTPQLGFALAAQLTMTLVFSFLRVGRYHFLLKVLRTGEGEVGDVLGRAGILLKAIGQQLYIMVLTLAWGLPGGVLTVAGSVVFAMNPNVQTLTVMESLYMVGMALTTVLAIRATLHYTMAPIVLADHPETGVFASVRASKAIMGHRKLMYIMLMISFIGWALLEFMAESMLTAIGPIVGLTLGMALQLALTLYQDTAVVAFYEAYRPNGESPVRPEEPMEELNP